MATQVQVPALGESVTQAILLKWYKNDGDKVGADEPICELETDKANVDVPSPAAGVLRRVKDEGDTVAVGEVIARVDDGGNAKAPAAPAKTTSAPDSSAGRPVRSPPPAASKPEDLSPAVRKMVEENAIDPASIKGTGPSGRLTKEDVVTFIEAKRASAKPQAASPAAAAAHEAPATVTRASASAETKQKEVLDFDANGVHRAPLSKIRKRIAETLVKAQQTAAMLTTFNEIDLSQVMELRTKFKERFQEVHGVGLGFMSFFARASVLALKEFPRINAFLEGDEIVYHNYVHLGIAVSTDRGLAVPVMRHAEKLSFAKIELEVKRLAAATRDGKLGLDELSGATFTITNGGVFGSLLSTPILNPPQSGILGMHAIQKRPVAINDKVEIRPMMYVALTYDHRLVDGRESVSFLVRLKQLLEDPARLMLEI